MSSYRRSRLSRLLTSDTPLVVAPPKELPEKGPEEPPEADPHLSHVVMEALPPQQEFVVGPVAVLLLEGVNTRFPLRLLLFADRHVNQAEATCRAQSTAVTVGRFIQRLFQDQTVAHPLHLFFEGQDTRTWSATDICKRRSDNFLMNVQCIFYDCFVPGDRNCPFVDQDFFHTIDTRMRPRFYQQDLSETKQLFDRLIPLKKSIYSLTVKPKVLYGPEFWAREAIGALRDAVEPFRPLLLERFQRFGQEHATDPYVTAFVNEYTNLIENQFDSDTEKPSVVVEPWKVFGKWIEKWRAIIDAVQMTYGWLRSTKFIYFDLQTDKDNNAYQDVRYDLILQTLFPQTTQEALEEINFFMADAKIWKQYSKMVARFDPDQDQSRTGVVATFARKQQVRLLDLYAGVQQLIRLAAVSSEPRKFAPLIGNQLGQILSFYMDLYTVSRMLKIDSQGVHKENIVYYAGARHWSNLITLLNDLMPLVIPSTSPSSSSPPPEGHLQVEYLAFVRDPPDNQFIQHTLQTLFQDSLQFSTNLRNDAAYQCLPLNYSQVHRLFTRPLRLLGRHEREPASAAAGDSPPRAVKKRAPQLVDFV